jgi:hypothetical protein
VSTVEETPERAEVLSLRHALRLTFEALCASRYQVFVRHAKIRRLEAEREQLQAGLNLMEAHQEAVQVELERVTQDRDRLHRELAQLRMQANKVQGERAVLDQGHELVGRLQREVRQLEEQLAAKPGAVDRAALERALRDDAAHASSVPYPSRIARLSTAIRVALGLPDPSAGLSHVVGPPGAGIEYANDRAPESAT